MREPLEDLIAEAAVLHGTPARVFRPNRDIRFSKDKSPYKTNAAGHAGGPATYYVSLDATGLRVGVKAGGCSGFEYVFAWEPSPKDTDLIFPGPQGVRVWIDPRSHRLLDGTTLDYDTSLLSRGFMFQNPHAKATHKVSLREATAEARKKAVEKRRAKAKAEKQTAKAIKTRRAKTLAALKA